MKIAVPTRQGYVDDQLACCECYIIYTVDEQYRIVSQEEIRPSTGGCCVANPAARLRQRGVSVVLAGNVEATVYDRMTGFGMEVLRNNHGQADLVVKKYLDRFLFGRCDYCQQHHREDHLNN